MAAEELAFTPLVVHPAGGHSKKSSVGCITRLRSLVRLYAYRPKPKPCTASEGLVERLPPELIAHILIVGEMEVEDLVRCREVCSVLSRAVDDPANDVALWKFACMNRWAQMALNPAECYREELAGKSYKMRYRWAEADGKRRRGTVEDLLRIEAWDVKFIRRAPYRIDNYPYRCIHSARGRHLVYRSPTFGHELRSYGLSQARLATYVQVDGIPEVKMVRRPDWCRDGA